MKDDLYHQLLDSLRDNMYDLLIGDDLTSTDSDRKEQAEYMLKCKEESRLYTYTSVEDPFMKGHYSVIRHKRNEPRKLTFEEERYNSLSWVHKIWINIKKSF